jgi:hypothetical protein
MNMMGITRRTGYENGVRFAKPIPIKIEDLPRIFKSPARDNLVNVSLEARRVLGLKRTFNPLGKVVDKMVSCKWQNRISPPVKTNGILSASKVRLGGYTSLLSVQVMIDRFFLSMKYTVPFYGAGMENLVFSNLTLLPKPLRDDNYLNKKEDPKYSRVSLLH